MKAASRSRTRVVAPLKAASRVSIVACGNSVLPTTSKRSTGASVAGAPRVWDWAWAAGQAR